ncbi:Leucine-rich repeat-containing protein 4C [Tyrophagus putrescentiae]|nr:Leucine-rich repeat-containing protein 4C [Tyrophagus putrescentiae]
MASLGLHDNRWRCDCHLKAVREWIAANNVPLPVKPVCSAPARLQGQKWDSISAHEFSCPPQIHSVTNHYYKHIGNNVTISCPVTGYPQPVIFWLFEGGSGSGGSSNSPGIELFESRISSGGGGDHHTKSTSTTLVATNRSRSGGGLNGGEAGAFSDDVMTSAALEESSSNPPASSPSTTTTTTTLSTPSLSTHSPSSSEVHPHQNSNKLHHPQHLPHHPSAYEQLLPNFRYSVAQEMENSHQLISTLTVHSLKPSDSQRITCYARNIGGTVMKNFTLDVTIDDPFTSSRSMDFIVTEMFVIALSISILFLVVIIFVGCFIVKLRKRPGGSGGSAVHAGENSGNSCTANGSVGGGDGGGGGGGVYGGVHNHHHHSVAAAGATTTIPPFNDGGFIKQQPAIFTGWGTTAATATTNDHQNKEIILDGQTLQYTTPNGNANTGGILMHHDHNNSTDLSSQSTTATSMTVNTTNNQYHLEEGVNGYATLQRNASFRQALVDQCSSQIPSQPQQQPLSMTPDLLVNSSTTTPSAGYYLAEMSNGINSRVNMINCDGYPQTLPHPQLPPQYHHFHHPHPHPHPQDPAFPLLNSGPLTMTEISAPLNQAELIYGTRIAPTRPSFPTSMMMTSSASCHGNLGGSYNPTNGKVSKVKFADQLEQQQQQLQQTGGQRSSTATDSYVYATIRKQQPLPPPTFPRPSINNSSNSSNSSSANSSFNNSSNSTEQQQQQQPPSLKPLSAYHRGVGSYPEGFSSLLLLESSVDSGDQISSGAKKCLNRSVDSLDEAEEDDYYRTLNGGVLRNGGTNVLPEVVTSTSSATSSTELQHPPQHQQQQLNST